MRLISVLLSAALLISSCSQAEKKVVTPEKGQESRVHEIFDAGNKLMDAGEYKQAAETFEKARIKTPASTLEGLLLYNTALSYQLAGDCAQAFQKFREVVNFANKDVPNLAVRAKHRMGEALSCMGQDQKAIVVLVEAFRQRQFLPASAQAELPARIAALYARVGQRDIARKYLQVAEKGLAQFGSNRRLLAETLFQMGDVSNMISDELHWKKTLSTYAVFKRYLVRSAALGQDPWSTKALNSIAKVMDGLWQEYSQIRPDPEAKDRTLAIRNAKAERQELLKGLLVQVNESKNILTPKAKANSVSQALSQLLQKEELKIKNQLASESVGAETTEEAKKLDAIRREGRVKSAPTVLEKQGAPK